MNERILSVIIPAFNETSVILGNVDEVSAWIEARYPKLSYEVLVVDDGSTDGMREILLDAMSSRSWLRVVSHDRNRGRGKGIRTGFENAKGEFIICLDADLSYSPSHIEGLLEPLRSGGAEITLASAHHPEGALVNVPRQRAFLSKVGNKILAKGFSGGFSTVTCVVRGFTRKAVESLELVSEGKDLHLEILQKAELLGLHIREVPATLYWRDRKRGSTKNTSLIPDIAIIKMRKTVLSHLVFNYITNPGVLLFFPTTFLLLVSILSFSMLSASFVTRLLESETALFMTLRMTLVEGQLTLLVGSLSLVFLIIFSIFYFLSNQSKRYFEEQYTLLMRMNQRIKELERNND